jgi:hypothetical protein
MTRSKSAIVWASVAVLGLSFASAAQAQNFAQTMGFGYGPGYNAPGQAGCQSCQAGNQAGYQDGYQAGCQNCRTCIPGGVPYAPAAAFCSAAPGCCEIPANWRQHVWNGYRGDPCTWHNSFYGVPKPPGYGFGYGGKGGCPTCQPCQGQPAFGSGYAVPVSAQQPMANGARPVQY